MLCQDASCTQDAPVDASSIVARWDLQITRAHLLGGEDVQEECEFRFVLHMMLTIKLYYHDDGCDSQHRCLRYQK